MTGYVYVIADSHNRVKLGWSAKPELRLVKAQTDNGGECKLIGVIPATREQEKELQGLLSPWRLRGEWFDFAARPVKHFLSFVRPMPAALRDLSNLSPLKQWRKSRGIPIGEFAAKLGVNKATISRIENRISSPSWKLFARIRELTNNEITLPDLMRTFSAHPPA